MCRQLAYFAAGDLGTFDVIKLAYSLCTYYEVAPSKHALSSWPRHRVSVLSIVDSIESVAAPGFVEIDRLPARASFAVVPSL